MAKLTGDELIEWIKEANMYNEDLLEVEDFSDLIYTYNLIGEAVQGNICERFVGHDRREDVAYAYFDFENNYPDRKILSEIEVLNKTFFLVAEPFREENNQFFTSLDEARKAYNAIPLKFYKDIRDEVEEFKEKVKDCTVIINEEKRDGAMDFSYDVYDKERLLILDRAYELGQEEVAIMGAFHELKKYIEKTYEKKVTQITEQDGGNYEIWTQTPYERIEDCVSINLSDLLTPKFASELEAGTITYDTFFAQNLNVEDLCEEDEMEM